jgi:hypothetical protein
MCNLQFSFEDSNGSFEEEVNVRRAIIAGWTSSNSEAVEKHIQELEELGVQRPDHTPCFYPVSASRLTTEPLIQVIDTESSGEVEFVLLMRQGELWLGLGSDHTDRKVETYDVVVSKQLCDKPIANNLWRFSDIESHWEELLMKAYIFKDGERTLYQEGSVTEMINPLELIKKYEDTAKTSFAENDIMYGGTFPTIGGIQYSPSFEFEITDPILDRVISHKYQMEIIDL